MTTKKNILILSSRFPFPLEKGDKLRLYHQIKSLAAQYNVFLFSVSDSPISNEVLNELKPWIKEIYIDVQASWKRPFKLLKACFSSMPFQVAYFYNAKAKNELNSLFKTWEIDAVYCQLIRMMPYAEDFKGLKIIDFMDAFSLNLERRLISQSWWMRPLVKWELAKTKTYEQKALELFDKQITISQTDADFIKPNSTISLIKNGVDFDYFESKTPKPNKTYDLVFVGNMQYRPNVLAAQFLVQQILPLLESNTTILLAGAQPTKDILDLRSEQVTVSGWMDDIRDAYVDAQLFVAPLFTGSGLQNKLLEAMSLGLPVLTTDLANASLEAKNKIDILIENSAEGFANQIKKALENPEQLSEQSASAKAFVKQNYCWEQHNKSLIQLFENQ